MTLGSAAESLCDAALQVLSELNLHFAASPCCSRLCFAYRTIAYVVTRREQLGHESEEHRTEQLCKLLSDAFEPNHRRFALHDSSGAVCQSYFAFQLGVSRDKLGHCIGLVTANLAQKGDTTEYVVDHLHSSINPRALLKLQAQT